MSDVPTTPPATKEPDDPRFNAGLIHDVVTVLDAHGDRRHAAVGAAVGVLSGLERVS